MKPEGEMDLGLMFVSNLLFGGLLAWVALRTGKANLVGGAITGATVGLLVYLSIDLSFISMMNMYANTTMLVVDVLASTVWATGVGAVAGLVLGWGAKAA